MKKHYLYFFIVFFIFQLFSQNVCAVKSSDFFITERYYQSIISDIKTKHPELIIFANLLPKGGDIHHHFTSSIYDEDILDNLDKSGACIDDKTNMIVLVPPKEGCLNIKELRADRDRYDKLLGVWSNRYYLNNFPLTSAPITKFFSSFKYVNEILEINFVHENLKILKQRAKNENVQYIETMFKAAPRSMIKEIDEINNLSSDTPDSVIEKVLSNAFNVLEKDVNLKNEIKSYIHSLIENSNGIDDDDFTLRFQAYTSRLSSPSMVFSGIYSSFKLAKNNNKIVGINIAGPENDYISLRDYILHMKMANFLKRKFPDVKISLHSGELAFGSVNPENLMFHITDAVKIVNVDRIGHGVGIIYESDPYKLINDLKQKNILVEINLSSNKSILEIDPSVHPVSFYLKNGVPIAISSDDPAILRTSLSNEYFIFIKSQKPSYVKLKEIVYNSIKYSFLSNDDKAKNILLLDKKFLDFENYIAKNAVQSINKAGA